MEAVGGEVIVAIAPILLLVGFLLYTYRNAILNNINILRGREVPEADDPVNVHPLFGGGQCSICLDQPKKFEVSATCGHSFCGACLFDIYDRNPLDKILCPLCRKQITTIFKSYHNDEGDASQRHQIDQKAHAYNQRFDDNRPWARTILEFPYVFRRVLRFMVSPMFWALFIRSFYCLRAIMFIIIYFLMPFDLIPEKLFGVIGFLDDIFILFLMLFFAVTLFAVIFLRNNRH